MSFPNFPNTSSSRIINKFNVPPSLSNDQNKSNFIVKIINLTPYVPFHNSIFIPLHNAILHLYTILYNPPHIVLTIYLLFFFIVLTFSQFPPSVFPFFAPIFFYLSHLLSSLPLVLLTEILFLLLLPSHLSSYPS